MTEFEVIFCGTDFYLVQPDRLRDCIVNGIGFTEKERKEIDAEKRGLLGEDDEETSMPDYMKSIYENFRKEVEKRPSRLREQVMPEKPVKWSDESKLREYERLWRIDNDKRPILEITYDRAEPARHALPPLPAGATRHKALPHACLSLPDAAAFMKGMPT